VLVHRHGVYQVADGHHRAEGAALEHTPVRAYVAYSPHHDEPFSDGERGPFHGAQLTEPKPPTEYPSGKPWRPEWPGFPRAEATDPERLRAEHHRGLQAGASVVSGSDDQPPKGARFFHGRTGTYPAAPGDILTPQPGGMRHMYYTTHLPTAARAAAWGQPLKENGRPDLDAEAVPGHVYEVVPETAGGRRIGRHAVDPDSGLPGAIQSWRTKGRLRVLHEVDRETGEPLQSREAAMLAHFAEAALSPGGARHEAVKEAMADAFSPDAPGGARAQIAGLPDLLAHFAAGLRAFARNAEANLPLHPDVTDALHDLAAQAAGLPDQAREIPSPKALEGAR
jgi:hypothetical protein